MLPVNFSAHAANAYGTGNSTNSINGTSRTPSFSTAASSKLRRLRGTSNATMPTHVSLALPVGLYSPTATSLAAASTNGANGVNSSSAVSRFQEGLIDAVVRRIKQSVCCSERGPGECPDPSASCHSSLDATWSPSRPTSLFATRSRPLSSSHAHNPRLLCVSLWKFCSV